MCWGTAWSRNGSLSDPSCTRRAVFCRSVSATRAAGLFGERLPQGVFVVEDLGVRREPIERIVAPDKGDDRLAETGRDLELDLLAGPPGRMTITSPDAMFR